MADVKLSRQDALKNNTTPNGKVVGVQATRGGHIYTIRFEGGGELPEELGGGYTSGIEAQTVINRYLNSKWDAEEAKLDKKVK